MQLKRAITSAAAVAALASASWAATGQAKVAGTVSGSPVSGLVTFEETKAGLKVTAEFQGVPPGAHGFHIHEFGDCSDTGKAAGGHYNPRNTKHGHVTKDGVKHAHAGDMGNVNVDASGSARVETVLPGLTLSGGKQAVGGRAVIIHEKADDFGQPVGNAGGRIGCGPIVITGN